MPWFKVDDGFHGHPKVVELSLAAVGLWTLAGSWCAKYLTDGFVPDKTVVRLGASHDEAAELVTADLWLGATGGYEFKDWADYQPLKEDVEAERDAARERMKKVRAAKKGARKTPDGSDEVQANTEGTSEEVRIAPSHPIPVPTSSSTKKTDTATRGSRITPEWLPSAASVALIHDEHPHIDPKAEHPAFLDYWIALPGARGVKLDWDATWRNWMRRRATDQRKTGTTKLTPEERARATLALATELKGIDE